MEFSFKTKALRRLCEQEAVAKSALGDRAAAALQRRLADIEAVDALTELPWLNAELGDEGQGSIEFYPGYRLEVLALFGGPPVTKNPKTDWSVVDRVKIIGITRP